MSEHVATRCLNYRLLFPGRSIHSICALERGAVLPRQIPRKQIRPALPVVDVRKLLQPGCSPNTDSCAGLHWLSDDGEYSAFLIVDAVEQIVHCDDSSLCPLPALPRRISNLCDLALRIPDGTFSVRVRTSAHWPMQDRSQKRDFLNALVALSREAAENISDLSPDKS